MGYTSWSVVFGEQPSAAKWNLLGTNDAYFDSLIGAGTAWSTWSSPIASGVTAGNGTTNYAKYQQIGKNVDCRLGFTLGSTSSITGQIRLTLPVTSSSNYVVDTSQLPGTAIILDSGTARIDGGIIWHSTTQADLQGNIAGVYANYVSTSASAPMVWTTGDGFYVAFRFEAA